MLMGHLCSWGHSVSDTFYRWWGSEPRAGIATVYQIPGIFYFFGERSWLWRWWLGARRWVLKGNDYLERAKGQLGRCSEWWSISLRRWIVLFLSVLNSLLMCYQVSKKRINSPDPRLCQERVLSIKLLNPLQLVSSITSKQPHYETSFAF